MSLIKGIVRVFSKAQTISHKLKDLHIILRGRALRKLVREKNLQNTAVTPIRRPFPVNHSTRANVCAADVPHRTCRGY